MVQLVFGYHDNHVTIWSHPCTAFRAVYAWSCVRSSPQKKILLESFHHEPDGKTLINIVQTEFYR